MQIKFLETVVSEMINTIDGINSRLDNTEERNSKNEHMKMEIGKKKRKWKLGVEIGGR